MACGILHIVRPLRPAAPVRPARRPRGRGRGGPPRPPLSPGRLLESVAGVRELGPHTGTPVPLCRGVGLVSRAGSPRQGALSAVVASVGGCAAGRPTPHTALVEESGSQRGSWGTHRRRAGGPERTAGHGGVCGGAGKRLEPWCWPSPLGQAEEAEQLHGLALRGGRGRSPVRPEPGRHALGHIAHTRGRGTMA
jgi:hypothetical protein